MSLYDSILFFKIEKRICKKRYRVKLLMRYQPLNNQESVGKRCCAATSIVVALSILGVIIYYSLNYH